MTDIQTAPRYLLDIQPDNRPIEITDTIVIGSGIAGARSAVGAAENGSVTMLTKQSFDDSNTDWALGGIAAALPDHDTPEEHAEDTIEGAHDLGKPEMIRDVVREGVDRVQELIDWGAEFDRSGGEIDFTKEGGHSVRRVLHAQGDQTGRELSRVLWNRVNEINAINVKENAFVLDLLVGSEGCDGVLYQSAGGEIRILVAGATILASGGSGHAFRETTNPPVATGDGVAMAYRAGAAIRDMEFYQFHPTTLYIAGSGRSLVSESVRGEGAFLVDRNGTRFMKEIHPDAELAPRDVVCRGIVNHLEKSGDSSVYLDLTHMDKSFVRDRFPRLAELCDEFEIDIAHDLVPVHPSAHYQIGGVRTDERAQTSIPRLLAAGEVASTKFHGANRLGSNSLLEGLVFGARAGEEATQLKRDAFDISTDAWRTREERRPPEFIDLQDLQNSIQSLMWRQVGILRSEEGLRDALYKMNFWCSYLLDREMNKIKGWEIQNIFTVSRLITLAALHRKESRGTHYRTDYPEERSAYTSSTSFDRSDVEDQLKDLDSPLS